MSKSAQAVSEKFVQRAAAASGDYVDGARSTTRDQSAAAIAAKAVWKQALDAAAARGAFEKGLAASGKQGWLDGVVRKGGERFGGGVAASANKYATNSGKYDGARQAAANLPRGLKGSEQNIARVRAVVSALNKQKTGASA